MTFSVEQRLTRVVLRLLASILVIVLCNGCISGDTVEESLSIEEAQDLVPFDICLPDYVPEGMIISPSIRYHADFGDPNESDVTLRIVDFNTNSIVMEIIERYTPGRFGDADEDEEFNHRVQKRELLAWFVESKEELEEWLPQIESTYEVLVDDNGEEYRITQITSPENFASVTVRLEHDPVLFKLYSVLSIEETLEIAYSLEKCSN